MFRINRLASDGYRYQEEGHLEYSVDLVWDREGLLERIVLYLGVT